MPRRTTPFVPDIYYHFYNRGNNRQAVFFESDNYLYFLRGLKKYLLPVAHILAYCLMPTHYHILVRIRQTSEVLETSEVSKQVSLAMQKFLISYTKAINKRFQRVGALFQGQFQAKPIQSYPHLLNLCIYIHGNPVKDGLVKAPEDWIYSNYLEWLGQRDGPLVDREFIQEHFSSPAEYRELVTPFVKTRYLTDDVRKYLQSLEA
ncbi:MAG TPA: transposase [Anaerolineales bacterium]|nr:transposase [Anaerolineales bacterium]